MEAEFHANGKEIDFAHKVIESSEEDVPHKIRQELHHAALKALVF